MQLFSTVYDKIAWDKMPWSKQAGRQRTPPGNISFPGGVIMQLESVGFIVIWLN